MNRLNRQINAGTTAKRWAQQYPRHTDMAASCYPRNPNSKGGIRERLDALGDNPDPDTVDAIIGNTSWTNWGLTCSECKRVVSDTIVFDDYDNSVTICKGCLRKALELIKK
jgi:hypothetical protein